MTRRIVLELAEDTTDEFCGSCKWYEDAMCHQWHRIAYNERRISECLAAESRAERMVEIDPEDAAEFSANWAFGSDPEVRRRVTSALREHAKKAVRR